MTKGLAVLLLLLFPSMCTIGQARLLHAQWTFSNAKENRWYPARVPGTVHTDLLANHLIPDPFFGDHEAKLQWVGQQDWIYQTVFDCEKEIKQSKDISLQFDGLDTYADIYLNEILILSTDNMFRTYRVDITHFAKARKNALRIVFHSAEKYCNRAAQHSPIKYPCENNRNYARKAQYHFGWDWAPRLLGCGIWRKVQLCTGQPRPSPEARYSAVNLVRENDSIGQSFYFTIKGKPTFMRGANWIPADVFLPRISRAKYRSLLMAAKDAGMNMLRVWGGGIYEDDYFYELCDSLGIYVWQDFMFAGAMYTADNKMLDNVRHEAIDNILRLRRHPCIVLWCGNNEIDEAWHNWGWQKQFSLTTDDSIRLWRDYQKIFHELLPELVRQYDSGRAYIASSPLYGWGRPQSMTHGDSHYWGMWWGVEPISVMKEKIPRFMSEYGMQAMPSLSSIKKFLFPRDCDTASTAMKLHQKHPTGFQTLSRYLQLEKINVSDFQSFIDGTQELQSRAIETALTAQMRSNGRCMGSLLWQFNDCWPVCSWSIIDYYGQPKKAYTKLKTLQNKYP